MGLYNVVAPCVVNELHFTRRSTKPIQVDDKVAAPLVELGALEPLADPLGPMRKHQQLKAAVQQLKQPAEDGE